MATISDDGRRPSGPSRFVGAALEGRPLLAFVAVLLVTGGHTMNLRELGVSQGWVAAEVYALQSCYLFSLAVMILACPALSRRRSHRSLTRTGLVLAIIGPALTGIEFRDPLSSFLISRAVAGAGAGMVIYSAPKLLPPTWRRPVAWAVILCPVVGTGAVAAATMMYESSEWRQGFVFEGVAAALGLVALMSMGPIREAPARPPRRPPSYLPSLILATVALIYVLHWGQLHGWLESPDIAAATTVFACSAVVSFFLAWPQIDMRILGENWPRLALFAFGGICQFFHGYIINVYGGTMVNLSTWERAWMIWPMPIGMAVALTLALFTAPHMGRRYGRADYGILTAVVGLLILAVGLNMSYQYMMEWPYWDIRDVADLNWFQAPGQWELAPGRFLMGMGVGMFMAAMDARSSPDPEREATLRPYLSVAQFASGALGAAVLINFMIIGHKVHYSYSSERDSIQAEEMEQREALLLGAFDQVGKDLPVNSSRLRLFQFLNYEADNLVFATMYFAFLAVALVVAVFFGGLGILRYLGRPRPPTLPYEFVRPRPPNLRGPGGRAPRGS